MAELCPLGLYFSAKHGNETAQSMLGDCYYYGKGVTQNDKVAVYYYKKAAEQGEIDAQNNLGLCYYDGKGVPKIL